MLRVLLIFFLILPSWAWAQTISFTFDDGMDPGAHLQARAWNDKLLAALAAADVKAMLFPAGKIVASAEGMRLVEDWGKHGHAIGNHTYAHKSLGSSTTSLENFTADVLLAEEMFKNLPGWTSRLRFPFLKEGDTQVKRDGMRLWMVERAYLPAPVSIDTSDWYYNNRFAAWRNAHPAADPERFRDAYLEHLRDRANYYERLARSVLGRSPKHVMLLHTNQLNATFFPEVVALFRRAGWTIVSPLEAFADPLYRETPAVLPAGESIIWALAKQANYPGLRYPAENDVYEEPLLRARGF